MQPCHFFSKISNGKIWDYLTTLIFYHLLIKHIGRRYLIFCKSTYLKLIHGFFIWCSRIIFAISRNKTKLQFASKSRCAKVWFCLKIPVLFLHNFQYPLDHILFRKKLLAVLSIFCQQCSQRPRIDLNERFLPRPNTTTAWKLIP